MTENEQNTPNHLGEPALPLLTEADVVAIYNRWNERGPAGAEPVDAEACARLFMEIALELGL